MIQYITMKQSCFLCCVIGIALIALLSGCSSIPFFSKDPTAPDSVPALSSKSGMLFDAQTGNPAGEYEFSRKGNAFVLSVKTDRTAGQQTDGTDLSYAPYEGLFGGVVDTQKTGYRINGADDYNHFFIFIHDQPKTALPAQISAEVRTGKLFLLTVVDKPIYEEISESGLDLPDAIKKLAPFIRTQVLIAQ